MHLADQRLDFKRETKMTYFTPDMGIDKQIEIFEGLLKGPADTARPLRFTPELAQYILEKYNAGNRPKRTKNIQQWADAMKSDAWGLTGQTIIFSKKPYRLLDGQHRLLASILAEAPFRSFAVFGIDGNQFALIDSGSRRNNADVLSIAGAKDPSTMAAALRWSSMFEADTLDDRSTPQNDAVLRDYMSLDPKELALLNRFCVEGREITANTKWKGSPVFSAGQLAGLLYVLHGKNQTVTTKLIDGLKNSKKGNAGNLVKALQKIVADGHRIHDTGRAKKIIATWQAVKDGLELPWTTIKKIDADADLG